MKAVTVLLCMLTGVSALRHAREYYEEKFVEWMQKHNITFGDGAEFVHRLEIWAKNEDYIREHNAGDYPYTLGHNKYSHMSLDEFHRHFRLGKHRRFNDFRRMGPGMYTYSASPNSLRGFMEEKQEVDWVEKGVVTGIKDQGACGSCWAFSTTGALEGAYAIKNGKLVSFSEQELVDCDPIDAGCNGGLMDNAFSWIERAGGLMAEDAYPYRAIVGACHKSSPVPGSKVKGFVDVDSDDASLVSALNHQPVSVAIEADQLAFQLYAGGVFTGSCGTRLDHGVLAVGYGTIDGVDYYKVKNSWGESWGDNGFILIQRNKHQQGGQCGILEAASYVQLA